MNTTTLFDLNKTASGAAVTALGQDELGTTGIELEAFTSAGHDRADFPQWQAFFQNHVKNYTTQKATLSPAAKAAAQAAAAATAAANKAAAAKAAPAGTNANTTQAAASVPPVTNLEL
jgi:hypothetical protein